MTACNEFRILHPFFCWESTVQKSILILYCMNMNMFFFMGVLFPSFSFPVYESTMFSTNFL